MTDDLQSRMGRVEGEIDYIQRDIHDMDATIKGLTHLVNENAKQINKMTEFIQAKHDTKKEWSKIGIVALSTVLTIIASVVTAIIVTMIT